MDAEKESREDPVPILYISIPVARKKTRYQEYRFSFRHEKNCSTWYWPREAERKEESPWLAVLPRDDWHTTPFNADEKI